RKLSTIIVKYIINLKPLKLGENPAVALKDIAG
ncbi:unnamed protein product, partial [marine sediment metagenome]